MARLLIILFFILYHEKAWSQEEDKIIPKESSGERVIYLLDSLANAPSVAKYFSAIYYDVIQTVEKQMNGEDTATRQFIQKFEISFIFPFIDACLNRPDSTGKYPVWMNYFSGKSLRPLQYQMMGINAHINGDMWKVLVAQYSKEELLARGKHFIAYQQSIRNTYYRFFSNALLSDKKLQFIHLISFGTDRFFGERIINKWRKDQERLAILYYTNPNKFKKKLTAIEKRKQWYDRLIVGVL